MAERLAAGDTGVAAHADRQRLRPASARRRAAADSRRRARFRSTKGSTAIPTPTRSATRSPMRFSARRRRGRHRPSLSGHRSGVEGREQHRAADARGRRSCAAPATRSPTSTSSSSPSGRSSRRTSMRCARTSRARSACDASQVSVKGKTNEGVDSMGAGEAIAVHAVALIDSVASQE